MKKDSNQLVLVSSVWLSYLVELDPTTDPIYINMPNNLVDLLGGETALLYPYEWTDEQIETGCTKT